MGKSSSTVMSEKAVVLEKDGRSSFSFLVLVFILIFLYFAFQVLSHLFSAVFVAHKSNQMFPVCVLRASVPL